MKFGRMTVLIIILICLPAIGLTNYVIVENAHEVILDDHMSWMSGVASHAEANLETFVDENLAILEKIARDPGTRDGASAIIEEFYGTGQASSEKDRLRALVLDYQGLRREQVETMMVDVPFGAVVYSPMNDQREGYVLINGSNMEAVLSGSELLYLPSLPWASEPALAITQPVVDTSGTTVATLTTLITATNLGSVISTLDDLGTDGGVFLVGPDGRLITGSPMGGAPGEMDSSETAPGALTGYSRFQEVGSLFDLDRIELGEPVERWSLAIVVVMDGESAAGGLQLIRMFAIASGLIVGGAMIIIALIITKNLVRDVGSLVKWSKRISKGDWEADLELGPTDEFQELEVSFKQMVRDMRKHQSQLRQAERRFANLFMSSLDPVYIARADGRIAELNKAGEAVLGLPRLEDGTYGYSLEELFADDDNRQEFIRRLDRENAVAGFEARLLLPSGRELFVLLSATRRLDDQGRTTSYQGVIHDITDRKHFEEALIEAKNEAEFYCDIMSHDLNNAVQGLGGYLELCNLATDLEDVNQFLPYAHDQMSRASDLLRNVRRLSHLGSQELELKAMDLQKVLAKASWAVERMHPHEAMDISYEKPDGELLVKGEAFLEDVFVNLLDNAIKYDSHKEKTVKVEVSPVEVDGTDRWRVRVTDRGPGVADRDKQTIFGRFERRALKEYGTGLGLSIVVKAVERCGGRTWVEDRVRGDHTQGAAFVVELLAVKRT